MAMRRSDHVLTELRSQQEEKDVSEIHHKAYRCQVRITQKNGLGGDFWNILAQDFII